MRKKLFVLLLLFKNIYAQNFYNILSKEDNLAEYEKMWALFRNHFRTKINITDAELEFFEKIGKLIKKNKEGENVENVADKDLKLYKAIELKIDKKLITNTLLDFVEKSDFFNENKNNINPFDSELIKNILLHGFKPENRLFSKVNISGSFVTEVAQSLNFLKPENIDKKVSKIKELNDYYGFNELNDLFNILRDNEIDFIKIFGKGEAWERYGIRDYNNYIEIKEWITDIKKKIFKKGEINKKKVKNGGLFGVCFVGVLICVGLGIAIFPLLKRSVSQKALFVVGGLCFALFEALFSIPSFINFLKACKNLYNPYGFYSTLSQKFHTIKTYISSMKKIYFKIKENPVLFDLYKEKLNVCNNIFETRSGLKEEQIKMLELLDIIPDNWEYKNRNKNKKVSAKNFCKFFLLFDANKDIFVNAVWEIASIGVDVNSVNLLKDKTQKNKWCVPTLITQNLPFLFAKGAWSPVVGQNIAVDNDIQFGTIEGNRDNKVLNHMVLAGVNAGGKTTFMKTVACLLLLAQSFGICNAAEVKITPYDKIFCMFDVGSDPERDLSEFQNQIVVSDRFCYLNNLSKLNKMKLFLFADEALMGTNNKDYVFFMNRFLEDFISNIYLHSINAVHMPTLVDYAKDNPHKHIYNYRMNTEVLKDSKRDFLKYTYKIIEGSSEGRIAQALAKKMFYSGILKTPVFLQ